MSRNHRFKMSTFSRHSGPVGIVKLLVAPSFLPSPESARVAQLAERVVVANPGKVQQIAKARVKTDIRDTFILARLLAANLVPQVWVPRVHVREPRQLLSQRRQLVETHTQIVNRMHSVAPGWSRKASLRKDGKSCAGHWWKWHSEL